ncbi:MAG: AAA family ATPase [Proteobacteria bacterium]|nr:AAA family ATPase [Desulfobacterales bacterium]MBU0736035.1 AAA family ATPase [Pseudomonadota bacterium]MBU1903603.1 AAA family ATPase [Pseudomonadota bacterium]
MDRIAEKRLTDWLDSNYRKPLIIRGARQVGKSTLVRQFADHKKLTLHEVNLERHPTLVEVFKTQDTGKILRELEFICGKGSISGKDGLLFLDEIQAAPIAIQTLRYFYEDHPELPVISAGSLLEFTMSKHSFSMPVGRVEYLYLGPVTFEETLAAMEKSVLLDLLSNYHPHEVFPQSAHDQLLELQRVWLLVGGMPEAIQRFIDTNALDAVFDVHASIIETYKDDFAKYATQADLLRLHKVFNYVPMAAGEKFKYVRVDPEEQSRELGKAVDLLEKAQIIMKACHTDASGLPLGATINRRIFKPFFLDCGLMNTICGVQWISLNELKRKSFVNKGHVAEQFIAQHLAYIGKNNVSPVLTYWLREGRAGNAEIDFITQLGQAIVPVEVKAGKSGSLKSLQQFVKQKKVRVGVRFDLNVPSYQHVSNALSQGGEPVQVEFDLLSLPLYMIEELPRIFGDIVVNGGHLQG